MVLFKILTTIQIWNIESARALTQALKSLPTIQALCEALGGWIQDEHVRD
jgi:hypothetical protein